MNTDYDFVIINLHKALHSYSKVRKYIPNYMSGSFYKISKSPCLLHYSEEFQLALETEYNWTLCKIASLADLKVF